MNLRSLLERGKGGAPGPFGSPEICQGKSAGCANPEALGRPTQGTGPGQAGLGRETVRRKAVDHRPDMRDDAHLQADPVQVCRKCQKSIIYKVTDNSDEEPSRHRIQRPTIDHSMA